MSDPGLTGTTASQQESTSLMRKALVWSRYVFMPLAVGFILFAAWSSRELLRTVLGEAAFVGLVAAVLLWSFLHLNVPAFDMFILKGLGNEIRYPALQRIYSTRLPTKYLPGGIWHNVTRLLDLNQADVPRLDLTSLAILQVSVPACVAFAVGGTVVALNQGDSRWGLIGAVAAGAASLILLATPYVLNRTLLRGRHGVTISAYAAGVALTALTWTAAGSAFYAYVSAYPILASDGSWVEVAGTYLLAWGVGFISIVTPQGLGVFEATAATLIDSTADFQAVVAILAGFRVIILISDALAWIAFHAASRIGVAGKR